jgi:alkanesulfonate monooxygenase SsuD/methylene tetrahydromethanopterin reductase-like flavin-dependent oxidoreductase (luciferase family)
MPFSRRYAAVRERVAALRTIWTHDEPSFDGEFEHFSASWVEPKPVQQPLPVAFCHAGPLGMRDAALHADEWCPYADRMVGADGRLEVEGGIAEFRRLAGEAGRDPEKIPISLFVSSVPEREVVDRYEQLGVTRLVLPPPVHARHGADVTLRWLDRWAPLTGARA